MWDDPVVMSVWLACEPSFSRALVFGMNDDTWDGICLFLKPNVLCSVAFFLSMFQLPVLTNYSMM